MSTNKEIAERLLVWGVATFGNKRKFALALGWNNQATLNSYTGKNPSVPGNILKARLRELGADVDYILTGRSKESESNAPPIVINTVETEKDITIGVLLRRLTIMEEKYKIIDEKYRVIDEKYRILEAKYKSIEEENKAMEEEKKKVEAQLTELRLAKLGGQTV